MVVIGRCLVYIYIVYSIGVLVGVLVFVFGGIRVRDEFRIYVEKFF